MSCALPEITVYNGTDNVASVVVGRVVLGQAAPVDLTTATRITLRLYDAAATLVATVDSDTAPAAITWASAPTQGQVDFTLGGQAIAVGSYRAKLVVYSPAFPVGELFVPAGGNGYTMNVEVLNG